MAAPTTRYGTALLSLTTSRPPDSKRRASAVHVDVALPSVVANEIERAEQGARALVQPREAVDLLWNVPAAAYVTGRFEGWRDLPGIGLLEPGYELLVRTSESTWPEGQAALRSHVATAAAGASVNAWLDEVERLGLRSLLNDLVLIFKFATLHRRRPLEKVAGLYRLVVACSATSGPANRDEVIAWLNAPLAIAKIFAAPILPPPSRPGTPTTEPPRPRPWRFAVDTPAAVDALKRIEADVAVIERRRRASALTDALRAEGVSDPTAIARVNRAVGIADVSGYRPTRATVDVSNSGISSAMSSRFPAASPRPERMVRTSIAGHAVIVDIAAAQRRADRLRATMAEELTAALPTSLRDRLVAAGVTLDGLPGWGGLIAAAIQSPSYLEPVGRSDLLVVRQATIGYRRAEIAFVENILVGETRKRQHTQRIATRREVYESIQREQEETRDLQTTDRAELNREIGQVINEDLRAQGSVEVTSRGPTKVVASAAVSFDRSTEEAAKVAEEYSRETIERAVKRSLERVTREMRSVIEQETTEINEHGFSRDANSTDHVSGLYQYLERISRARIFWYGERELYDLLIPEPAALIWQFAISRNELHNPLEPPDAELFASLTLANIAEKREEVIRAFRVTDLPELPPDTKRITMPFGTTGGGDGAKYATSKELQIPDGYEAVTGFFGVSAEVENGDEPNGGWLAGNLVDNWIITSLPNNQGRFAKDFTFPVTLTGPTIAVAMNADNFTSISGSLDIDLRLTDKAREAWAIEAFGRVAERYEQLRREYETTVIQLTASFEPEETKLPEGSRIRLQQMIRFELQRAAIDLMRNAPVDFDLITDQPFANADGSPSSHPVSDIAALKLAELEIRFLQQAFEWEHMSWVLYPYFWGRRSEWDRTVVQNHPDPDFAAFLNAGAARVQISVRPGFEHLVKHFMETGEVYGGDGLPKMGDPGYISFIDEQMTALGAPGEEIPWPPDAPREWDVVAPTSLVLARSLTKPQLPTWDAQTGEEL